MPYLEVGIVMDEEIVSMSDQWIHEKRNLLDNILDLLIPANPEKRIPSAGVFGVGEFITARAMEDDTVSKAIKELLFTASSIDEDVSIEMVEKLEADCALSFSVLVRLTYMGYYSRPEIRSVVGLGSWPVHPKGYEVPIESADMLEKLIAPVKARGQAYREPNDG